MVVAYPDSLGTEMSLKFPSLHLFIPFVIRRGFLAAQDPVAPGAGEWGVQELQLSTPQAVNAADVSHICNCTA